MREKLDPDVDVRVKPHGGVRMRIGELSRRTGITHRALRYYEEQGLLRPGRRSSMYREFTEADVLTVQRIRVLLAAGLTTATIAEVLTCLVGPCPVGECVDRTTHCARTRGILDGERDRLSDVIDALRSQLKLLDEVIETPHRLWSPDAVRPVRVVPSLHRVRERPVTRRAPDEPTVTGPSLR